MRERISLNGWWDWSLPGGKARKRKVPSSYLCVGEATFEKYINLDIPHGKRAFLVFEGIAYDAVVTVNNQEVGRMLPYVRYRFDVTDKVAAGDNQIKVAVRDITAAYGPAEGWESYGGIIRDVFIEISDNVYIEDYYWTTCFSEDYKKAACTLKAHISNRSGKAFNGILTLDLAFHGTSVSSLQKDLQIGEETSETEFAFDLQGPLLWSPQFPNLYDLSLSISDGAEAKDQVGEKVGFREFKKIGTKFFLNGQKIIIKGVCRHDTWGDGQGFTLTPEQMEQDMQMIKHTGANFVRLVHYPHHKAIIEITDRLGLMVSEEPGLWNNDLEDDQIIGSALEVMKRTILRDRNHASVVFWLAFNECVFTDKYLSAVIKLCRELDPGRMVSGANFMNAKWTKEMFKKHGVDFYTYHPYGHHPDGLVTGGVSGDKPFVSIKEVLEVFNDKPVLFTEWGGWPVRHNPALFREFLQSMMSFCKKEAPEPNLAGMVYWVWADIVQVSRGYPACEGGVLTEGLVDLWRNKREIYYVLSDMFSGMEQGMGKKYGIELTESGMTDSSAGEYVAIDISGLTGQSDQEAVWKSALQKAVEENRRNTKKTVLTGPVIEEEIPCIGRIPVKLQTGRPLILSEKFRSAEIDIAMPVSEVCFIGHVTFAEGYPVKGRFGEPVAKYIFQYHDGTQKHILLRNGLEFTAANTCWGPSRLELAAANVTRAVKITVDEDWEVYVANGFKAEADKSRILQKIIFELVDPVYSPLLYGITVKLSKVPGKPDTAGGSYGI